MSISYYDFKNLSMQSQYELAFAEGKVISETSKDGLRFVLYELSSFTVEIVYKTINNKIEGLSVFQNKGTR
ncbi:hypothetical protein [Chryseobacterium wangxinyae]|uniref:hypothetical protein n=1 Tax=unclassified Chryseobacterium TaxID=2593645 RepID=UPI00226EF656|nr:MULTISPECIES: hypothetical protein [unclassified Chryseobacterium]MCY0970102.1 hypothetical protein [Chryseobacterium sp. CY353]MCY0977230.1 hypothetical protein [Chryseobacterium sp. CY350]WBZ95750.1 hypothetical protein PGH12_01070 [Chryseobacterium sp. CY350]